MVYDRFFMAGAMLQEGSERDIIPALAEFLKQTRPVLLVSLHPYALKPGCRVQCWRMLVGGDWNMIYI